MTFITVDPVNLPVPSRAYFKLHATYCRVAHLSGAGEYIDKDLRDIEVLSQDGTSAEAVCALAIYSSLVKVSIQQ